jgi:hypothetical protein
VIVVKRKSKAFSSVKKPITYEWWVVTPPTRYEVLLTSSLSQTGITFLCVSMFLHAPLISTMSFEQVQRPLVMIRSQTHAGRAYIPLQHVSLSGGEGIVSASLEHTGYGQVSTWERKATIPEKFRPKTCKSKRDATSRCAYLPGDF